jgi:hypothetical protein
MPVHICIAVVDLSSDQQRDVAAPRRDPLECLQQYSSPL